MPRKETPALAVHSLTCGRAANKDVILGKDGDTSTQ